MNDHTLAQRAIVANGDELGTWNATPAGVRDVVLSLHVVGPVLAGTPSAPTQREVETVSDMAYNAITAGRFIDFGYWPHDVIKFCGNRGGPLYYEGAMPMPFQEPWMFMHLWNLHENRAPSPAVYLVHTLDEVEFEVVEFEAMTIHGRRMLTIADRAILLHHNEISRSGNKYHCSVAPSCWRWEYPELNGDAGPEKAAASNVLDPVMTALLMLSTTGVVREIVPAPAKLNKHRVAKGKPPIPSYQRVASEEYSTAILARGQRRAKGEALGGHHASPVAHIRMGHFRSYESGKRSFIRDTLVNVTEEARAQFKSQRTHYTMKP